MLKKQTVWLLTMLSLMIVLSVYYMISPDNDDLAYIDNGQTDTEETASTEPQGTDENAEDAEVDEMTNIGGDELLASIRMEVEDERSMSKSRLESIVASGEASAEEKDEALKEIDELEEASKKEKILEDSILSSAEYQDVLVRSEDEKVHVHVKAEELSETEANNIMRMVYDEFGDITVDVVIQPADS
ncbi:SpoIIIAH-like family protein [Oceanobacillus halophilus]|uniref:SpoIIIAH-like family protein n=1 Tax=Oceanobacillus halophilus TaxID=930130 RepID=A0A495ACR6_9BACI|nr:SpoIIIAH-like family protein [Oceanobacillus halophilus]RKQ37756.1 SpoIIIAH-like family protein [Oceanobacillus halophilus]